MKNQKEEKQCNLLSNKAGKWQRWDLNSGGIYKLRQSHPRIHAFKCYVHAEESYPVSQLNLYKGWSCSALLCLFSLSSL